MYRCIVGLNIFIINVGEFICRCEGFLLSLHTI